MVRWPSIKQPAWARAEQVAQVWPGVRPSHPRLPVDRQAGPEELAADQVVAPGRVAKAPVGRAAGSRTVPLVSAAETVSPNHLLWAVAAHRQATRRRLMRVLPKEVRAGPLTLAQLKFLRREMKVRELQREELREMLELSRVLGPLPRRRKTYRNLPPHALAVPVSQHPWNRSELLLLPRLLVPVFNRPRQPTELRPLARM